MSGKILVEPVHCAASGPSYYSTFFMSTGVGKPCVSGMAVVNDENGTVVGDIENLKYRTFWKFGIF